LSQSPRAFPTVFSNPTDVLKKWKALDKVEQTIWSASRDLASEHYDNTQNKIVGIYIFIIAIEGGSKRLLHLQHDCSSKRKPICARL
jgi:hypothetical protein